MSWHADIFAQNAQSRPVHLELTSNDTFDISGTAHQIRVHLTTLGEMTGYVVKCMCLGMCIGSNPSILKCSFVTLCVCSEC